MAFINSIEDVEGLSQTVWDVVVIGTGMGGATLGHALAQAGQKVLFLEKGENYLDNSSALRGDYMEVLVKNNPVPGTEEDIARNSGRWRGEIYDVVNNQFIRPMLGSGAGGSTALYGMVLERFFPSDFVPRRYHQEDSESTLPDRWPVTYEEMAPFYARAEALYRVHSNADFVDPYRKDDLPKYRQVTVPHHVATRGYEWVMRKKKMNTYSPPLACDWKLNCHFCQSILCDKECKNDSAKICLRPAVEEFGATLLTRFEVTRLESDQGQVTGVRGRWRDQQEFVFTGRRVVLAAGALYTPLLLLRSRSDLWPQGLANGSGAVGRNLMRHLIDLYVLPSIWDFSKSRHSLKEIAWNNFYEVDGVKYGTMQPFGKFPPSFMAGQDMLFEMKQKSPAWATALFSIFSGVITYFLGKLFDHSGIAAPILEDLPQWNNRVEDMDPAPDGRPRVAIYYRISHYDQLRLDRFRRMIRKVLFPYPFFRLSLSKTPKLIAHVCGTARFGDDPKTSVLNKMNRAHAVDNLYVVDASFFPSSGGTNPALTIAANALRVAEHILQESRSLSQINTRKGGECSPNPDRQ